jgi:cell surface protein SprA
MIALCLLTTVFAGAAEAAGKNTLFSKRVSLSGHEGRTTGRPLSGDRTFPEGAPGQSARRPAAVRELMNAIGPVAADTTGDTLHFPISDRYGDPFSHPERSTIDLKTPPVIHDSLRYDPVTKQYYFGEKIGNQDYRNPTYFDYNDFLKLQGQQQEDAYWMQLGNTMTQLNKSAGQPDLYKGPLLFNRIFGGTQADIRPQGNLNITFGYEGQNYKNLTLPERARKTGGFVFPMSIDMNVVGQIGTKLKLTSNYNTQSVNDFDKQIKLEYTGSDNDIIKKIEAGNVSFPLRSQLITGVQSLFGIKTQLQFGRLTMTNVFSIQKSQKQNLLVQGGAQTSQFDIQADQYEENEHFLLAQYFYDHFDEAMSNLPIIRSQVHITRMEVWVTNKTGATTNTRNIVGLMDLGESKPYSPDIHSLTSNPLPNNASNDEYRKLTSDPAARNSGTVISRLTAMGLQPVQDFEKTFARKLDSTEYYFNPQIGFISLYRQLQPDEVLAVAYQYTYNGKVYQVGEFSQDVPPDSTQAQPKVLFLKLLKATSARPRLPIWDLMMKNIYNLGASQINQEDFQFNIFYQDPGGGEKRYLPDAQGGYRGQPLLSILNLDRLNNQNDPQPDGVFDFVNGFTINASTGRVMFPELEPFGKDLKKAFGPDSAVASKYLYQVLYDSTKTIAQQFPQFDRYVMRGSFKASSSSDIFLGAYNIPRGSVTVTAGGQQLIENVDYTIDYSTGRLKVINDAILNSGLPINVSFENNAQFGQQTRNYFGTRLDYYVNDKLSLGSTIIRMTEKPYFSIVNYGDDPISNTIVGFDANYRSDLPGVTHWLDKLPNYAANAPSSLTASGEVARLFPGHSKLIGKGSQGTVYLDDFEGASSSYDLKFPYNSWALASTPQDATDANGKVLFPESTMMDSLQYGYNRALLAWYTIEPSLVDGGINMPANIKANKQLYLGHYVRLINQQQVFPKKSVDFGQGYLSTLDLAYYPNQRGPYNFATSPAQVDASGHFIHPEQKWGGIMRALDNTDFEASNVQYIEFWVMDPFINDPGSKGGDLYIDLGNVSEDILRDGLISFENGLPKPSDTAKVALSAWGRVPKFQQQLTDAFDNDPASRAYQDVGYDGIDDEQENSFRKGYLQSLVGTYGSGSAVYQDALRDPDNDDYHFYRGKDYDAAKLTVLERYKRFNNSDGNSPISGPKDIYSSAATNSPESEDLNHDNTINESEEYFQYRVDLKPNMEVGSDFIVDKIVVPPDEKNGPLTPETWYQFRIPIEQYDHRVGDIPDFKSIRFMRMFLTGFQDSVVLRFAKLNLVRNQWMNYKYKLDTSGAYIPIPLNSGTDFSVSAVNLEENATRRPIPYMIPPGIQRQSQLSSNNVNLAQNEQSMSLKVTNLQNGDARAVFKNLGVDLRQYKRLQMFIHAEAVEGDAQLKDSDIEAVIRLGSDFVNNYYEYRIPLKITNPMEALNRNTIWPDGNNLDIDLDIFPQLKQLRNQSGAPISRPYTIRDAKGNYVTVVGNPNLGDVREALMGILNPDKQQAGGSLDDGFPKSAEVWFDELRVSDMDESGGYAAMGRMDLQLSDLGSVTVAGSMHTSGFGNVDQSVNERFMDNYYQYDIATNLELGKLLPSGWNLSVPVYAGYSETISNPKYDPYDLDIRLKDKLRLARSKYERDSILEQAQNFTSIKSLSFTNVRKLPDPDKTTNHLWDIENFDLSYSFSQIMSHNPLIASDELTQQKLGIGYSFSGKDKFIAPLRNLLGGHSRYLSLLRDFNINPIPSLISIRGEVNRQFGATRVRNIGGGPFDIPQTFDKYFTFDRYYNLHWDLTRSLNIDFSAVDNARIDEPFGYINSKEKKDTVLRNLLQFGRTTMFHQTATASYTLPLNKFPLLDWTNIRLGYSADYGWTAASRLAVYLGNSIQNSYRKQINGDFNFNQLYNKWTFLREINNPAPKRKSGKDQKKTTDKQKQSKEPAAVSPLVRALVRPFLMLKRIAINYSDNGTTYLPGYIDSTGFMGQNWHNMKPGLGFAFGWQPSRQWLDKIGKEGWLTPDSTFNIQYQQQFIQQLDAQATLEPFPGLRIDLNLSKSFSKNHTELFKDTTGSSGFAHLNPYDAGGFQVTYFSMKTMFSKVDAATGISQTFLNFENYRKIISDRLGAQNPYTDGKPDPKDPDYKKGYSRYAQDVLIPAFLAAYTGKSPETIGLLKDYNSDIQSNPFSNIKPFPNWKIKYNGLSKLPFFDQFVTNLTLSNSYSSILSMNSYSSALLYSDPLDYGYPGFIDSTSGNYIPYFLVPNITIAEQLSPLIGVDATFTNNLNVSFAYSKSRMLSLSLIDFQLTEMRSTEVDFGAGFRVRNFPLPFNIGKAKKLHNDLNFRLDMSVRSDKTVNNLLDAGLVIPTSGQKIITVSPSIDYVVNQRLNLHFFYTRRATVPVISTSFPISNTEAGVTLRFILQ